jgi:cell division protein FtsI (penicillin-binding protein 3)
MQIGVLLLFIAVMVKVAYTQTVDPEGYSAAGVAQRLDREVIPAPRGSILDRQGRELALSIPQQTAWADPRDIIDPLGTAQRLGAVLDARPGAQPTDIAALATKLTAPGSRFAYVARQLDDAVAAQIAALELPGINLLEEPRRFQPSGILAQSIVGATNLDGVGTGGIELLYDDVLTGTAGQLILERAEDGGSLPGERNETPPVPGTDVVLTIDSTIQYEVEQILLRSVSDAQAIGGMVVVMDPNTGDILAMANVERQDGQPVLSKANKAMVDVFEPGSVNKMITMSAALQEGVTRPETTWEIPSEVTMDGTRFHDAEIDADGLMTGEEIIVQSSNLGTYYLAKNVGPERLYDYLAAFGLTERTPINFPGESKGLLRPPDQWYGRDKVTIPYGQGVAVTAVQMLGAYNVIANGGSYVPPRLVSAVVDPDGTRRDAPVPTGRPVVSPQTAAEVASMLRGAVNAEEGTGRLAQIPGYPVAGKTGTAKKPQGSTGYLDAEGNARYMQVFAGMVPADNPAFTAIVVLDESQVAASGDAIFGGAVAAPVFSEIGKTVLRSLHVPPTEPVDTGGEQGEDDPAADAPVEDGPMTEATVPLTNIPLPTENQPPDESP